MLHRFGKRRQAAIAAAVLVAGGIAALLVRPWAESVMTVKVTVAVDGAPPQVVYRARRLLSVSADPLPLLRAEVDLSRWAGKLIRFDVDGMIGRRWMRDDSTGFVACEAELAAPEGATPIEFISWQQGRDIRVHTAPLGPLAFRLDGDGRDRFAFAMKGSLWHCLKPPKSARLRLRLKPVIASALSSPKPYVASSGLRPPLPRASVSPPKHRPDVFIYVIDALRADHLGCYGYSRKTSPTIDAFAAQATIYESAQTAATWTRPSVASMLTGLYPTTHRTIHWSDGLAQWPVLLPEMLQGAGYRTRCFVTNPNLSVPFGMDQGYDQFVYCSAPSTWANQMVDETLGAEDRGKPVFMYVHTMEPHHPYMPSAQSFARFDRGVHGSWDGSAQWFKRLNEPFHHHLSDADMECLLDLYDARVYEADQGFAAFLSTLKKAGRYDNSLIVMAADHGEAFGEHGTVMHDADLNQETMRVPLIVRFPGGRYAEARVKERASLVDIVPTVLAHLGLNPDLPYRLPGRDLGALAASPASDPKRRIWAEVARWDTNDVDLVAVIDEDGYKRVIDVSVLPRQTAAKTTLGLWDTRSDPRETKELSRELPVRAAYDEQLIAAWLLEQRFWRGRAASPRPPSVDHDEAVERQLRALGYLGGRPKARPGSDAP